jgi:hypothetical protein
MDGKTMLKLYSEMVAQHPDLNSISIFKKKFYEGLFVVQGGLIVTIPNRFILYIG